MDRSWKSLAFRSVLLLAVFLALATDSSGSNTWSLSGPESPLAPGQYAYGGLTTVGPNGDVYYCYNSNQSGDTDIYFITSTDFGDTWRPRIRVDTDPVGQNSSSTAKLVAGREGEIYVLFDDSRDGHPYQSLRLNRSLDKGDTWLAQDILVCPGTSSSCLGASSACLALGPAGSVYVQLNSYFYVSTDYGNNWSPALPFFPSGVAACMCSDEQGNIYVCWLGIPCQESCYDLRFQVSHDAGASWLPSSRVLDVLASGFRPTIACDENGHVYVAWRNKTQDGVYHITSAASQDYGETFLPNAKLDTDKPFTGDPSVAADCTGNVYVAWPGLPTRLNRSGDFGQTWLTSPIELEAYGSYASDVVANDNGEVFVSYSSSRPDRRIWLNYSLDGGRTFQPNDLQVSLQFADNPSIVSDAQGHVYVNYHNLDPVLSTFLRVGGAQLGIRLISGPTYETSVVIPPEGGVLPLTGLLRNQTSESYIGVLAMLDLIGSDGSVIQTVATKRFSILPTKERSRSTNRTVEGSLPSGLYRWRLSVGPPVNGAAFVCMRKQ